MSSTVIDTSALLQRRERQDAPPVAVGSNPAQMLELAIRQGLDETRLAKFMDLYERWEKEQSRRAYVAAMADFKAEPMRILKTKEVNIPGGAKFFHATLADICDGVLANLGKHGFSHCWEPKQLDNGWVEITCVMTHRDGHSERFMLRGPPDNSGKKNPLQEIGSTKTYLERYTLMAAVGMGSSDMDDADDRPPPKAAEPPPDGYDNWHVDMTALAQEGIAKLTAAWGAEGSAKYRRYVIKFDEPWWLDLKKKAERVKVPE